MTNKRVIRIERDGRISSSDDSRGDLASYAGRWRFEGEPGGLLLLREAEGPWANATLKLAGEINGAGGLADIVTLVCLAGWTGTLVAIDAVTVRSLAFEQGRIVGTSSTHASERVTEIAFRLGLLTRNEVEVVERAALLHDADPADIARAMRFLDDETIARAQERRAEGIFFAAVGMNRGSFRFYDAVDPSAHLPIEGISAQPLLIEHARRMDEVRVMSERVPSLKHVPRATGLAAPSGELADVLAHCNGKRSISDVGRRAALLDYEIMKAIHELVVSGHVELSEPRPRGPRGIVEVINEALVEMHRRAGTGQDALREALARFVAGHAFLSWALEGAGPSRDGTLSADRVTENLVARGRAESVTKLRKALDEYVAFGLFVVGGHVAAGESRALERDTADVLRPLERASHSLAPPSIVPRRA